MNKQTSDTDDSFNYLDAGIVEGELYEVSSSYSEVIDSSANDDNEDFGELHCFPCLCRLLTPFRALRWRT